MSTNRVMQASAFLPLNGIGNSLADSLTPHHQELNLLNPQEVKSAKLGLWLPEPQDSLTETLCKVYGISKLSPVFDDLIALHLALNPDIFAAHRPLEKKVIYLAELHLNQGIGLKAGTKKPLQRQLDAQKVDLAASKQNLEEIVPRSAVEVEAMRFVLGFNQVMGHIGTGVGIGVSTIGTLAGQQLLNEMKEFNRWGLEKVEMAKWTTRAELLSMYDARADDVAKKIEKRLGPTRRFLFNGTGVKDALYHGVPQSLRPDPITISAAKRLQQVATSTKVGGVAMVAVDAVLACQKLSATPQEDKLETAYNEIGGIVGTVLAGAGITAWMLSMATPVGWVGTLLLTTAGAVGGKEVGAHTFSKGFNVFGDVFGLKNGKLLNNWCD